jgi:hypothetical protein
MWALFDFIGNLTPHCFLSGVKIAKDTLVVRLFSWQFGAAG